MTVQANTEHVGHKRVVAAPIVGNFGTVPPVVPALPCRVIIYLARCGNDYDFFDSPVSVKWKWLFVNGCECCAGFLS